MDKTRSFLKCFFIMLPFRGKNKSGRKAAQQTQYSKGQPFMSMKASCRNEKSAFRMILPSGIYALFQVEKSGRIWYFIITKGDPPRAGKP